MTMASGACAPACTAKIEPSTAMPSVAPTMRVVLTRPEAVPARPAGTLATATALTGPVLSPRPTPMTRSAASMSSRLGSVDTRHRSRSPDPMQAMPAHIITRAPTCRASRPDSCETTTKISDIGSSASPATKAEQPPIVCR